MLNTKRTWRSATSPPQPRIGVAATFSASRRSETCAQSRPSAATSSSRDQPPAGRDRRKAVELAQGLVAPPLVLGVRRHDVVIGKPESDPRSDLGKAARHEPVVDLHACDVVGEAARRDDPADAPGDHALLERRGADRDGAIAHSGKAGRLADLAAVEQHALEAAPVEEPQIALTADPRDGIPFLVAGHPPGRERRVVEKDDAGALGYRRLERRDVEPPL